MGCCAENGLEEAEVGTERLMKRQLQYFLRDAMFARTRMEVGCRMEERLKACSGGRVIRFAEADRDKKKGGLNYKECLVLVLDG